MATRTTPAHRTRSVDGWTIAVIAGLLILPWIAKLGGVPVGSLENRAPAERPSLTATTLRDPGTFTALGQYIEDRLPLRAQGVGLLGHGGRAIGLDTNSTVFSGADGTLFLAEDFTANCQPSFSMSAVGTRFEQWDSAAERGNKTWTFMLAPDKGAVFTENLPVRTRSAGWCAGQTRTELGAALVGHDAFLPLWEPLKTAEAAAPGSTYYDTDSHWTFAGASVAAEALLHRLAPGLWDPSTIRVSEQTAPVLADQEARLGIDGFVRVPVLESRRTNMLTETETNNVGGVRTVRTYRTTGELELVEGTTVVIHDSMANFMELQLAPYFESIVFVHWDDIDKANGFELVASADHVVLEIVERTLERQMATRLLEGSFAEKMTQALSGRFDE